MLKLFVRNKKARSLIACALLCALLLAGCSLPSPGGTSAPPAGTAAPAGTTPAPQTPAEPTPEPTPEPYRTDVVLSELQAANKATVPDADGDFSDWIELYNPGAEAAELGGCWLSDDKNEPCKWQIPELTIESGSYRMIFCSKKDRVGDELHTNFKLSSDGDTLLLSSPEGDVLWEVSYESCPTDASLCFEGESVRSTYYPTPGWPNTEDGCERFNEANDRHGALVINEAVTYNDDFFFHAGGYYDWVELRNDSGSAITLSDYYVTDDTDDPFQFQLPNTELKSGATFVVYCGEAVLNATSACHAPFKLNSKGDCFYIYRADGTLSDYVSLYGIPLNHSKGRLVGEKGFFLFPTRSPAAANSGGRRQISMRPECVTPSGVYDYVDGVDVELSGEGTIYYTLNGTIPDRNSYVYKGPIHLTKTTEIRAISAAGGKLTSETASFTFVINEYHELPVVCVALEPMKLTVLHNNGNMEYDSHVEYYGPEGSFASDCMITLHGAASRSVWPKKSFKVVFRDRYGGDVTFDLFGQGITEFHSLNLRGGDSVTMKTYREPLSAEYAERVAVVDPYTLDSRFCVLYINGEYRGIYSLREAYSKKYVASHTGSDEDLSYISRSPITQPGMRELYNFIVNCNINDPENYQYIADRLDLQAMAQWLLLEVYFNNRDTDGNIRYFVGNQPDSKWRPMFFDLDISMENGNAFILEIINPDSEPGRLFSKLLSSQEFRRIMLETASGLYKNGLGHELALEILDRMADELASEMPRNLSRWGESQSLYEYKLSQQRGVFTQARDDSWLEIVRIYTGADAETMAEYFPERG